METPRSDTHFTHALHLLKTEGQYLRATTPGNDLPDTAGHAYTEHGGSEDDRAVYVEVITGRYSHWRQCNYRQHPNSNRPDWFDSRSAASEYGDPFLCKNCGRWHAWN